MIRYKLEVTFDANNEIYDHVTAELVKDSYEYHYGFAVAPPHVMKFIFDGLSAEGLEKLKAYWRGINPKGGHFTTVETYG